MPDLLWKPNPTRKMALFRKFFYRKPPEGLLEISERFYVFDCCFTTDIWEDDEYRVYMGGIVAQPHDQFPDASFLAFNFREGESQSLLSSILSYYDMTVIDYPRHYEGCPVLTMETIHHFLRSSESWLLLGQQNVLLMHCERGGWPVLAFMVSALLIYKKHFCAEQKTLDTIYKQAPRQLLQLMSPLNPVPSQLRYLQYVSRRNVSSDWPPLDRALTLDCVIIRDIPSLDAEGGCRPVFRIYGQDPYMPVDRTSKLLFSTPKMSTIVRHHKQADCQLVKIDLHCHVQGDVVMECISLDSDLEREQMMFRVMFNTGFVRSNILLLNREEIDRMWDAKDQFPKNFRAEVLFSEMDSAASLAAIDLPDFEEKDGLPVEAFSKVKEIFSNVDWLNEKTDVALDVLPNIRAPQQNLELGPRKPEVNGVLLDSAHETFQEKPKLEGPEDETKSSLTKTLTSQPMHSFESSVDANSAREKVACKDLEATSLSMPSVRLSSDSNSIREKAEPQELKGSLQSMSCSSLDANSNDKKVDEPKELQVPLLRPVLSKIICQRVPQTSLAYPFSQSNSSPVSVSIYHSSPSGIGITTLLHDHAAFSGEEIVRPLTLSLRSSAISAPLKNVSKAVQHRDVSTLVPPPPPPPPVSLKSSIETPTSTEERPSSQPQHSAQPTSETRNSSLNQHPETSSGESWSPSPTHPGSSTSPVKSSSPTPPPPPPPLPKNWTSSSAVVKKSAFTPPTPPPPPSLSRISVSSTFKSLDSTPTPPGFASSAATMVSVPHHMKNSAVMPSPPPSPPPPHSGSIFSAPISHSPPPPPPPASCSSSSINVPPVPPPPAPFGNGLSKANGAPSQRSCGVGNGNVPPAPGPPFLATLTKAKGYSRTGLRSHVQPRRANLKPYHWLKLTRAMQGSLWAETQQADEALKAPEFDMSELERLFAMTPSNSDDGSTGGKSNRRTSGPKFDKVQLIELRRAYNCEIMLSKVKVPLFDLMSSVLALDDSALDVDQVDNLIKFCPTKEEMELLKGYDGDREKLGKCEQFFLELMKVPRVESKLRVFSFKLQFSPQVAELRNSLNIVNSTSEEIRSSVKLKRIMQTILSLGNALNYGTARGSAIGFRLDSLLKLTDTRARNNRMTLMHYLCKVLGEKVPELLDFPQDLMSLEAATKIQLKYLAEEMQAIHKGLEKVVQELTASENDGPVSESFCKNLKAFLSSAESEVRSLAAVYSNVGRNADALALYFGEDPARCPFEQVVSTLLNFVRMFVRAHGENCKQLELEKKTAEKDAENGKMKTSVSKRKSENLAPNRSENFK